MTRFLSHALGAVEPYFHQGLKQLETANSNPGSDIRLSSQVSQAARRKLMELGLDPYDTTSRELYQALQRRVQADDARLTRGLRTAAAANVSAEADVVAGMVHVLQKLPDSKRCFALKSSRLKVLLKAVPSKKAMKSLGYRSADSMLKHEPPVLILTAAWLAEGDGWHRRFLDQYKRLQPGDFEDRNITLLRPDSKRWQQLAAQVVAANKHNLVGFKELGALVLLPLPADPPPGVVTASLGLALHELNEIRAAGTFLKLSQFKTGFGKLVRDIAGQEPKLNSQLLDEPVPWNLVHRYYAGLAGRGQAEVFEPYLQLEDIAWHPIEKTLSAIAPGFKFWQNTAHLGLLDGHQPVSFNLLDAALNFCNHLPYEQRLAHYFRHSLWHELLLRYLNHRPLEDTVLAEIQPPAFEKIEA